jgi:carbonic anhydrase/acetyltransferase-like protein (isoleucine patch superfamily)
MFVISFDAMIDAQSLTIPIRKGKEVFIADTARVVGQVSLGSEVSVWFSASVRGDADEISVGDRTNIQDNAVLHADPGFPCIIGTDCIIGHSAVVHGATLGNHVLIGIHATVLNGCKIGEYCIIGASALLTEGMVIPARSLVLGVPAKVIRTLSDEECESLRENAEHYVELSKNYLVTGFHKGPF